MFATALSWVRRKLVSGSTYSNKAGELIVMKSGDHWLVKGDLNGDGGSDFAINVYSTLKPSGADFIF